MALTDNTNALLLRRKMARRNQSQTRSSSVSTSTPTNLNSVNQSKDNNVKSHSNAKRVYRSGDERTESAVAKAKSRDEIEFDKKINQLNSLKERPPTRNELTDFNYFFDNEGVNSKNNEKENNSITNKQSIANQRVYDDKPNSIINDSYKQEPLVKDREFTQIKNFKSFQINDPTKSDKKPNKDTKSKAESTKATNWNDDEQYDDVEDLNNYSNENKNGQASYSIQKSLNMYRFKK
ncbi:unnamed protein product [Brachionus calyciflorus]|uniref:Uncharacterized protein n=1 Tax=Brachionus calyciflorus TaxID=104777 RepID=A0A813TNA1_9BILA|nr:unnamed protein product [Brachionus calyciflorus]